MISELIITVSLRVVFVLMSFNHIHLRSALLHSHCSLFHRRRTSKMDLVLHLVLLLAAKNHLLFCNISSSAASLRSALSLRSAEPHPRLHNDCVTLSSVNCECAATSSAYCFLAKKRRRCGLLIRKLKHQQQLLIRKKQRQPTNNTRLNKKQKNKLDNK